VKIHQKIIKFKQIFKNLWLKIFHPPVRLELTGSVDVKKYLKNSNGMVK